MWSSTRRPLHGAAVVALLACFALSACTAPETAPPVTTADSAEAKPLPQRGELDAGTYLVTGFTVPLEITVPDGWESGEWFIYRDGGAGGVAVNFQTPAFVPADACSWRGVLVEVGPSAKDFADAMAAQTSTGSTSAAETSVGGREGLQFDHWVEEGVDLDDCDEGKLCLHSYVGDACNRWHSTALDRETYRVVDLDGERAVLAVLQAGSVEQSLAEEARAVFDSVEFASDR